MKSEQVGTVEYPLTLSKVAQCVRGGKREGELEQVNGRAEEKRIRDSPNLMSRMSETEGGGERDRGNMPGVQ